MQLGPAFLPVMAASRHLTTRERPGRPVHQREETRGLDVEALRKIMWDLEHKRCGDNCPQWVRTRLQAHNAAIDLQWLDDMSIPTHVYTSVFYIALKSEIAAVTLALQERKTEVISCRAHDNLQLVTWGPGLRDCGHCLPHLYTFYDNFSSPNNGHDAPSILQTANSAHNALD